MKTSNKGINYAGFTGANKNQESGIRFGVISQNDVDCWFESSEADYGNPHCPHCGDELPEDFEDNSDCPYCTKAIKWVGEECFPDSPLRFYFERDGYKAEQSGEDCDIFILKSPYFTYAQFCSPCAPGACYLVNELETPDPDNRAYCFGHDWFEDGKAPYTVYSVETGEIVQPE